MQRRTVPVGVLLVVMVLVATVGSAIAATAGDVSRLTGSCRTPGGAEASMTLFVDERTRHSVSASYRMSTVEVARVGNGFDSVQLRQPIGGGDRTQVPWRTAPGALVDDARNGILPAGQDWPLGPTTAGDEVAGYLVTFGWEDAESCFVSLVPPVQDEPVQEPVAPRPSVRLQAADPTSAAAEVSRVRFAGAGQDDGPRATAAVLARDDDMADALAGSPLTGTAPLLLTPPAGPLPAATLGELLRVLPEGGTVYVLGGDAAIGADVVAELELYRYVVERLAGPSRVETAIQVANRTMALGGDASRVALVRAFGTEADPTTAWADSVGVAPWAARGAVPVLVTPSDAVHPGVADWLAYIAPAQTVLLGGPQALSAEVEAAVPGPFRVAGAERAGTAVAVTEQLLGVDRDVAATYVVVDGYRLDGWAYGLAAAGLAVSAGTGLLLVGETVPDATAARVDRCAVDPPVDLRLTLVGDDTVIGDAVQDALDGATTRDCE